MSGRITNNNVKYNSIVFLLQKHPINPTTWLQKAKASNNTWLQKAKASDNTWL